MKLVIADTGPLIHLHQADALDLLPMLGEVVVTPQVVHEWSKQFANLRPQSLPTCLNVISPSAERARPSSRCRRGTACLKATAQVPERVLLDSRPRLEGG